tara:strand:- start:1144 stop:1407 length:264 start_codon:yes stop_codon:yes gene_type:complete
MKVSNMISKSGNNVSNQFIIKTDNETIFQSYKSIIAKIDNDNNITLDSHYWDYSKTTSKYRNMFLNMTTNDIKKDIKLGNIKLDNLN